jgi:hypothetical protein
MSWKAVSALAAALALTGAFAADALAQRDDNRVLLGERKVRMSNEKDTIKIPDEWKGRGFRRLFLKAERGELRVYAVRLVYDPRKKQNAQDHEDYDIGAKLKSGQEMEIQLRGERKYLEQVEFLYRAVPSFDGAVVSLYGVPSRWRDDDRGARIWIELGCKKVAMDRVDRDVIHVDRAVRRNTRFKAIRLIGKGADVHLLDLKVVYDNGAPDDIQVRTILREGDRTRPLDLRGVDRVLDRIQFLYERIPNFKGRAEVCAEGLRGR